MQLDDTDLQLIALLRDNARTPVTELATRLRVSRTTVQKHISKLEQAGIIIGYTVRLKPQAEAQRIRAWMGIAVEGNKTPAVLQALRGEPHVYALHSTNGRWDIVTELRADSLEQFDRVLGRIRLIPGITASETSLLLSTHKV
ncbi:Lrp/AsnC family transcriptional regulator [Vogesella sp. XCS3]|jgi:DNA-binding Lrp family transcriptional regulator|uniref:Lrp/AsnC family transcriptional regulator n=1 Tax=Vogesella sp. XCS3 TaxID=2877939 RepID=UPI001B60F2FF|nr:Lrp/AsnC family transcriptional regulator [Vogesella sp. XCS3]MBP7581593.1 Lrp/AsnC family transcriptional regulator [Vogesella sp.]UDM16351.1 Lrp/AsnC family transcriptional regulator [Vogesella sp. XCS3]